MPSTRQATVIYKSGLAFEAVVGSGHAIAMDASAQHGGHNSGPSPMELLLASLGGCTGIDVVALLRKMRQGVTAYRVEVTANRRDEHPRIFTEIHIEHILSGHGLDPKKVARAVELSATRYCSASAMLGAAAELTHSYRIEGDAPAKQRSS